MNRGPCGSGGANLASDSLQVLMGSSSSIESETGSGTEFDSVSLCTVSTFLVHNAQMNNKVGSYSEPKPVNRRTAIAEQLHRSIDEHGLGPKTINVFTEQLSNILKGKPLQRLHAWLTRERRRASSKCQNDIAPSDQLSLPMHLPRFEHVQALLADVSDRSL